MTGQRLAIVLVLLMLFGRESAAEDLFVGGLLGGTFRAATGFVDLEQGITARKPTVGVSAGWLPEGWLGLEAEATFVPGLLSGEGGLVASSLGISVSGNVLISPLRNDSRVWVYGTAGAGAISVRMRDVADVFTTRTTLPAINAGGGLVARVNSRLSIRADLRYFRTAFRDPPPGRVAIGSWFVHFWRGSAGVVVRI
jgi:hypothetical protein